MSQKDEEVNQKLVVQEKLGRADIYQVNARSILNKATGFIDAYDFTLNPYRGCQYGCSYCYAAAFSPDRNLRQNWGNWVIIKENAESILTKELTRWHKKNLDRLVLKPDYKLLVNLDIISLVTSFTISDFQLP